jgi:signal peptidase I
MSATLLVTGTSRRPGPGRHLLTTEAASGQHPRAQSRMTVVALILPLLIGASALAVHLLLHVGGFTVLSGSMRPAFDPGDILITRLEPVTGLKVGDVVVIRPPGEKAHVAHRIVAITGNPSRPILQTKGDANPAWDSWRAMPDTSQVPVAVGHIPGVGSAAMHLRTPLFRAGLVLLIGLGLTIALTRRMLRRNECTEHCIPGSTPRPGAHHVVRPGPVTRLRAIFPVHTSHHSGTHHSGTHHSGTHHEESHRHD